MPRLRVIEDLRWQSPDPCAELDELLGTHTYAQVSKDTYLRRDQDERGEQIFVLTYADRPLITFRKDGMLLDLGPWSSATAISRANAVLSLYGAYVERQGSERHIYVGETKGDHVSLTMDRRLTEEIFGPQRLFLCEAGGRSMRVTGPFVFAYHVEDRAAPEDDAEAALEAARV